MAGDRGRPGIATLRLPGAGWLLQWRADGHWREFPDDDDWVRWSGLTQPLARGGEWGGVATWWLLYGERPAGTVPGVVLADGTRPPVLTLGGLWASEWYAAAQAATVHVGDERFELPFAEPFYRRQLRADAEPPAGPRADDTGWFAAAPADPADPAR